MKIGNVTTLCGCALMALLAGCATDVPRRHTGFAIDTACQGPAMDYSPTPLPERYATADWPNYARNDDRLNARPPATALEIAAWSQPQRPTLDRPRRIHLYDNSFNSYTYFRLEGVSVQRRHQGWGPSW